jgi:hypothetical protein
MNHIIDVSGSMFSGDCLSQACHIVEMRLKPEDRIFIVSTQMEEVGPYQPKGCLYRYVIQSKIIAGGFSLLAIDIFIQSFEIVGPITFYSDDSGPIQSRRYREKFGNYISLPVCPVCYRPLRPNEFEHHFNIMNGDPEHDVYHVMSA